MAIYEPVFNGRGIYSGGFAKEFPTAPNSRWFNPKFGPNRGRLGAIITAGRLGYRFFRKDPRRVATIAGLGAGALSYNASRGKYRKALSTVQSRKRSKRSYNKHRSSQCCCCTNSHKRGPSRKYR